MAKLKIKILFQNHTKECIQIFRMLRNILNIWKSNFDIDVYNEANIANIADNFNNSMIIFLIIDDKFDSRILDEIGDNIYRRIILFGIPTKTYDSRIVKEFGVAGIKTYHSKNPITEITVCDDPSTKGLPGRIHLRNIGGNKTGVLIPAGAFSILTDQQGNPFLTRFNNRYVISIPVWQTGVPSFPAIFTILRNLLILSNGIGHFSPTPYVALRIDDLPLSSEQYLRSGGVSDESRCSEIKTLCDWSSKYDAKLEFMVSSHLLTP